jgi:isopropylmalate/homocitrate/citramalate synthase
MVCEYASLRGTLDGMDPTAITDIANYFHEKMGYDIPPMTPFVGKNFNITRAGIHADGMMKDQEIYNIFDTKKILNRSASVLLGKTSGLAGIAYWINENYRLTANEAVDKKDPLVVALKQWIDAEYEGGRQTALSIGELEEKIEELSQNRFKRL